MNKERKKQARLNFWLPQETCDRLRGLANAKGWTITEAVRNLITEGLETQKKTDVISDLEDLKRRVDSLQKQVDALPAFLSRIVSG